MSADLDTYLAIAQQRRTGIVVGRRETCAVVEARREPRESIAATHATARGVSTCWLVHGQQGARNETQGHKVATLRAAFKCQGPGSGQGAEAKARLAAQNDPGSKLFCIIRHLH